MGALVFRRNGRRHLRPVSGARKFALLVGAAVKGRLFACCEIDPRAAFVSSFAGFLFDWFHRVLCLCASGQQKRGLNAMAAGCLHMI